MTYSIELLSSTSRTCKALGYLWSMDDHEGFGVIAEMSLRKYNQGLVDRMQEATNLHQTRYKGKYMSEAEQQKKKSLAER